MNDAINGPLQGARQQLDGVIGKAIDHFAGMVPGGEQFTGQAKHAITGALDTLQQQLATLATQQGANLTDKVPGGLGGMLNKIFGGHE